MFGFAGVKHFGGAFSVDFESIFGGDFGPKILAKIGILAS